MIASPAHAACERCGAPAILHFVDSTAGTDRLFCQEHAPDHEVGMKSPELMLKRWRMTDDNSLSRELAAPKESQEHRSLRWDLCEAGLLGGDGACRYYLSIITGIDQFVLWSDEFCKNIEESVVSQTCPAAAVFCRDLNSIQFLRGFLRRAYERTEGHSEDHHVTKAEKAIELLLRHPDWSDDEIAAHVPTTMKQIGGWTDYRVLRATCQQQRKA
jgi:hypothetical protein